MEKSNNKLWVTVSSLLMLLMACQATKEGNENGVAQSNTNKTHEAGKKLTSEFKQVTVVYNRFEGGFYGLLTHDGKKLLPLNLDKNYRQDGAILQVKGEVANDAMTIQQWGTPFKISSVKIVKEGRKKVPETK